MTDDPQDLKKSEILPVSGQADLPAEQERCAFFGTVPNLPHEHEPDFIILRREFDAELTGDGLRFGHYIAHEAAVSRWYIGRYDQAMIATLSDPPSSHHRSAQQSPAQKWDEFRARCLSLGLTEKDIEAYRKDLDPSYGRSSPDRTLELELLVDIETRRYDENVDLMMQLNHSQHFLQKMAENVADISANEKQSGRGGLQRVGKGGQCRQQHQYLTKDKKLTNLSHIILGEPPLLQGESRRDYENLLSDTIEFCGGERPTELIAAHDIARETWQIHRLLKMREQPLRSAYSLAIDRMRLRPNLVANFAEGRNEAPPLPPDCGDDHPMDPRIILAEALHERFGRLKDIEGQIDRKRRRRRQTIQRALIRRGSRLRLTLAAPQDLKPIN